jgi:hypothetical protein
MSPRESFADESFKFKYSSQYNNLHYALDIHVVRPCLVHAGTVFNYSLQLNVCYCLLLFATKVFSLGAEGGGGGGGLWPLLLFYPLCGYASAKLSYASTHKGRVTPEFVGNTSPKMCTQHTTWSYSVSV